MPTKRPTAPGSERSAPASARRGTGRLRLDRRGFLGAGAAFAATLAWPALLRPRRAAAAETLPAATRGLLERSPFVYVSPLLADGRESTCHAEVWYGWIDGEVVLITSSEGWKSRALARGLDRARVWVGDHGRWKRPLGGRNESFREAPHFDARVERSRDAALLDRLMDVYRTRYPDEIGRWEPRMRAGFESGERWLLTYAPQAGPAPAAP